MAGIRSVVGGSGGWGWGRVMGRVSLKRMQVVRSLSAAMNVLGHLSSALASLATRDGVTVTREECARDTCRS